MTFVASVISTKGGVGKTTSTANISAFVSTHDIKVLMIDTDNQSSLSSYYDLAEKAPLGLYDFIVNKKTEPKDIISKTTIKNLDLIHSFDLPNEISHILKDKPDGRIRLKHLLQAPVFDQYDLILIDTKGTREILQEIAILASDLIISPIPPEKLATKEFLQGTLRLYEDLKDFTAYGFKLPPIKAFIIKMKNTNHSNFVVDTIKNLFTSKINSNDVFNMDNLKLLDFIVKDNIAYYEATSLCEPVHEINKQEYGKMKELCSLLFPQWVGKF